MNEQGLDALATEAASNTNAKSAAAGVLKGIAKQLHTTAGTLPDPHKKSIEKMSADLTGHADKLAEAIVAGTHAAKGAAAE